MSIFNLSVSLKDIETELFNRILFDHHDPGQFFPCPAC